MKKLAARAAKGAAKTVARHATKKAARKAVKKLARLAPGGIAGRVAVAVATPIAKALVAEAVKRSQARKKARALAAPTDLPPAFARVVRAYERDPDVTSGVMMSAFGLKVRGRIFAMLPRGRFVVKLPRARVDDLVARGIGRHFDPGHGRPMKEWIEIEGYEARWLGFAREAYAYVGGAA